jgi:NAD(P)-dependent dehydrogenase (short-subunit alcohol dehydrogenase family)
MMGAVGAAGSAPEEEHMTTVLDRFRLDGRTAIVTGASSGLGVAFALALAEAGADVVIGARRAAELETVVARVEQIGARCVGVPTDVTSTTDCDALVAAAHDAFGRVDVLVNNAGRGAVAPAHRQSTEDFDQVLSVNLSAMFSMSRAFAQRCIADERGGSIINVASVLGMVATTAPQAAYCASKAGIIGMTRDLALQWTKRRGIRVNALVPGLFESPMTDPLMENEAAASSALSQIPIERLGRPEELTGALLLLASDAGSYMTGGSLVVDGGWTAA